MTFTRYFSAILCLVSLLGVLSQALLGQQANSLAANMTVNGRDNGDYPIQVVSSHPGTAVFAVGGASGEPYAVFGGFLSLPGLDLGTVGEFEILVVPGIMPIINGFSPQTPLDALAIVPATGLQQATLPTPAPRIDIALQAVVGDPTHALGATLTATTRWRVYDGVVHELNFNAEDDSVFVPLMSTTVTSFGGTRSGFHVNSNGNLTFGSGDPSDQPSLSAFQSGLPRVAMAWRDLDPTAGGSVVVFESSSGAVIVDWYRVPMGDGAGGLLPERLSGLMVFEPNGDTWTRLDATAPGLQLTGFSPGPGAPGSALGINLSTTLPLTQSAPQATAEVFSVTKPFDARGVFLRRGAPDLGGNVLLDSGGFPLQVTRIVPAIGPTAGLASVHLRGTGFGPGVQVSIGGAASSTIDIISGDEIVVRTPPGALGLADIVVTQPGLGSLTLPGAYTYVANQPVASAGPLASGQSVYFAFPLGFVFPFYDEWYEGVWINANGSLSFGAADASTPATSTLMDGGPPRLAMLLGDWQWGVNSVAAVHCTPYFCTLGFVNLEVPNAGGTHSFQVVLSHHGEAFLDYVTPPPAGIDLLVGASAGLLGQGLGGTDLSAMTGSSAPFAPVWEFFDLTNPFDLGGQFLDLIPSQVVAPFFSVSLHP